MKKILSLILLVSLLLSLFSSCSRNPESLIEKAEKKLKKGSYEIEVSVDVENVGEYGGSDVVQLYIRDLIGSRVRPVKELKGYKKLYLEKGEKKTVTIKLKAKELAFTNDKMEKVVEEGEFLVFVAHDSSDSELSATFFVE